MSWNNFLKKATELYEKANESAGEFTEQVEKIERQYEYCSDEQLMKHRGTGTLAKKIAINNLLRARGLID